MGPIRKRGLKDQGAEVSLSGNLGFVSIEEVLRLISRAKQQGSVNVSGNGFHGRVFVTPRGIDLATTSDDSELRRHLVNSALVEPDFLTALETGQNTLADLPGASTERVVELFREMTVESLYQMARHGEVFDVSDGATTPFASPAPFELESVIEDAAKRASEWLSVSERVPDLSKSLRFERDLGDRSEVTIVADAWKVITEIGTGSSVEEIADRLGTTQFWTARVAGHMVEDDLLNMEAAAEAASEQADLTAETAYDSSWQGTTTPEEAETYQTPDDHVEPPSDDPTERDEMALGSRPDDSETEPEADVDPDDSWWVEPEPDEEPSAAEEEPADQTDDELEPAEESMFGRFALRSRNGSEDDTPSEGEPSESPVPTLTTPTAGDVEDDTEAFLEKVFSELESTDDEPAEEEGYGLLRRRGLGAARDIPADS